MKNGRKIYFDMDGVLAFWNASKSLEEVCAPGYFKTCVPDTNAILLLQKVAEKCEVGILTAVPTVEAMASKMEWIRTHLPFINPDQVTFVPFGADKSLFVNCPEDCVLVDDYTKNLTTWKGIGVKYLNGINNTHNSWKGEKVGMPGHYMQDVDLLLSLGRGDA